MTTSHNLTSESLSATAIQQAIEDGAYHGHIVVRVRVNGYWSQDPISIYVRRQFNFKAETKYSWTAEVSHSTGGRDTNELEDDLEATRNFANALMRSAEVAAMLLAQASTFEAAYQANALALREASEKQHAAKQAKIEADTALGEEEAKNVLTQACDSVKYAPLNSWGSNNTEATVTAPVRGEEAFGPAFTVRAVYGVNGKWTARICLGESRQAVSFKAAVETLAKRSHRSTFAVVTNN